MLRVRLAVPIAASKVAQQYAPLSGNNFSFLKKHQKSMKSRSFNIIASLFVFWLLLAPKSMMSQSLSQQLTLYNQQVPQEKIFIHLDRPLYLVGETIWFKALCVDAYLHKPLDMSKVAYVEILDKDRNAVLQTKIALENGNGAGSVFIPPFLGSGNYSVRSYTQWMKNFSADFYFETPITIANPFSKPTFTASSKSAIPYDLQLFPEGGHLVKDIESKIAFRAVGEDGKGIGFKGSIINQQNDTVAYFEPLKFGIGSFLFTPKEGNQYRVLLRDTQNQWFSYGIPHIQDQGYTLQLKEASSNTLDISVEARGFQGEVSVLVHTKSVPKLAEKNILNNGKTSFVINKNLLGEGISTITIFDNNQKPVCERLYFKRPAQTLSLKLQTDKAQYGTREKITLDLATTLNIAPVVADLSVSVFLIDSLPSPEQVMIEHYLGLTSDLKGTIESPSYYFNNTDAKANQAIDNLMLTHGWRRFKWEEITQKPLSKFAYVPEMTGHFITGKVVDAKTGLPAANIDTYLAAPSKRAQLFVSTSDSSGRVSYELKHFRGSKEVIVQTNIQKDSTYRVEINSPFSDKMSSYTLPSFVFDARWKNALLTRSINMQARNAFSPKITQTDNETDTLGFFGVPDEKYLLDAYTRFPTVEEVMREYVPGVAVRKRQKNFIFRVYDKLQANVPFEDEPLVMLDGVPIFDTDKIMAFDPLKIRKLEVIDGLYYLGTIAFSGIVSYTTYKGDLAGFPIDPRALVLSYEGVQSKKEFYTPRYDIADQRQSRLPDFRNLLHWSPQVFTNTEGKQSVSFYSSDQTGTYKVIVQGITDKGTVGSKVLTFEVKKASL
jgi:hypothetical protein